MSSYLEETQTHPLYPADPLARARHRAMIEFASAILSDIWGLEIAPTREVALAKIEALTQKFARLERDFGDWGVRGLRASGSGWSTRCSARCFAISTFS